MKLVPRNSQIFGRLIIKRSARMIILPDEAKLNTKFMLVDAVGPLAEAAGIKVGDVVLPMIKDLLPHVSLDGGQHVLPVIEEKDVRATGIDVDLGEFVIQAKDAKRFVPFDDPDAAEPLGVSPPKRKENGAAGVVTGAPA